MNQLLVYLNSLPPAEQAAFAQRCKTTVGYLRKSAYTAHARMGVDLCLAIAAESGGAVRPQALRPDLDWDYLRTALQNTAASVVVAAA
jgi:DNA-binding transcriptional regulator YdaS (Cro superfamily)